MVTLAEIEAQAMDLTQAERAILASRLLESIAEGYDYDLDGDAEALRRDAEMDNDPSACLTLEEFKRAVGR
jgi:putative addiction module component (TIGR02574 family)